jgi:hypothetical protein
MPLGSTTYRTLLRHWVWVLFQKFWNFLNRPCVSNNKQISFKWMDDDHNRYNIKMLILIPSLIHFNQEIMRSHMICNFDIQCSSFTKIDNTWWLLYMTETCSKEESLWDYKLHLSKKCMCTKCMHMNRPAHQGVDIHTPLQQIKHPHLITRCVVGSAILWTFQDFKDLN